MKTKRQSVRQKLVRYCAMMVGTDERKLVTAKGALYRVGFVHPLGSESLTIPHPTPEIQREAKRLWDTRIPDTIRRFTNEVDASVHSLSWLQ